MFKMCYMLIFYLCMVHARSVFSHAVILCEGDMSLGERAQWEQNWRDLVQRCPKG